LQTQVHHCFERLHAELVLSAHLEQHLVEQRNLAHRGGQRGGVLIRFVLDQVDQLKTVHFVPANELRNPENPFAPVSLELIINQQKCLD
jgi:hypothetical protein